MLLFYNEQETDNPPIYILTRRIYHGDGSPDTKFSIWNNNG